MIQSVTWPDDETELTDKLIEVIDRDDVFFTNKFELLASLAFIVIRSAATPSD